MNLSNEDNMTLMARYPDKYFELAIVDPPYMDDIDEYLAMQKRLDLSDASQNKKAKNTQYVSKSDFVRPTAAYFEELNRVSKKQIIWGVNHFSDQDFGSGRIIWDKDNTGNFNDCELAYQNVTNSLRIYKFRWNGMLQGDMKNKEVRIHPTHKPVKLYEFCLMNYAKKGDKILDTHSGGGSIAIACYKLGFDLTACEIDEEYYKLAIKRINNLTVQQILKF